MINLLPWRTKERHQQRQRERLTLIVSVAAILLLIISWRLLLAYQVRQQRGCNSQLTQQIANAKPKYLQATKLADFQKEHQKQLVRLKEMRSDSKHITRLFHELSAVVPGGVQLTGLEKIGQQVTLTGNAESHVGVVELMENLSQSKLFFHPMLQNVGVNKSNKTNKNGFVIKCLLTS
ncbi:MAG: PilN domain-containing protein [Gammaproteobacteria bacterium]|nr:PilN domain-containing protein [Gammaproteobacteria bacterium]